MKWSEIKKQYPDKFILIGNIVEKRISESQSEIIEAKVLEISDNGKEIMRAYRQYKQKGLDVLYSLPATSEEFIVRNVPFKGILQRQQLILIWLISTFRSMP
ncbi:MAG TPA: hypothetical protein ENK58_01710 [Desulfobacterales bacterium]|nr:MAG: hypothetical protein DRI57_08470 [Deltaproteobacteria bacterium]HHC24120.1 hypothetical protein [Desulfobacterales bacterium]